MIYGMMRIKNEARWIEQVVAPMLNICETVFIMDDNSDDNTLELCRRFPRVIAFSSPFNTLNETRDKNYLLEKIEAVAQAGDYILAIDGDEQLTVDSIREIPELAKAGKADAYRFQVLYLWDSDNQVRIDGVYANFRRASMFRLKPGARFHSTNGGGFHCGMTAGAETLADCQVKLLHHGYKYKEDRLRKFQWYNAPDKQPIPAAEDGYRHMILGDLLPPETTTKWAGPLRVRTL